MKINKILLVGEQDINPSIYTYITSFKNALLSLEYDVYLYNSKKSHIPFLNTMLYKLPNFLKKISNKICNKTLIKYSKKIQPDLIFLLKAENIESNTISLLKNNHTKVLNFFPDNPLVVWNDSSNYEVLKSIKEYDFFLSWSKILIPAYFSIGAKDVYYFPFAYDHNLFPDEITINPSDKLKYDCDVCFVGTWEPYRELWIEQLINIDPNIKLSIWGNLWNENLSEKSLVRKHIKGDAIYLIEMIKAFRLSKIVLNFIRIQNLSSHNMRTIETLASKAFLLTERTVEQSSDLFIEGEHLTCFSNAKELKEKINYYLNNETERDLIKKQGSEKVKNYILQDQLGELIKYIESRI
jgi:spore maturation protein CgeB